MVTSDFRPEVEIQPFRVCAMHPAIIIWGNSWFIVDVAMGQIPRSTERISLFIRSLYIYLTDILTFHYDLTRKYDLC